MTEQPPPWQQMPILPPQQLPLKKKHHKWPWITLGTLAALIIIIAATGHGSSTPTTSIPTSQTTQPAAPAAATTATRTTAAAPVVIYQKSGTGTASTPDFTTGAEWQLAYTYDCSNFGQKGNFAILNASDFNFPDVDQLGASGADTVYVHNDSGAHALEVDSECKWTMTVSNG